MSDHTHTQPKRLSLNRAVVRRAVPWIVLGVFALGLACSAGCSSVKETEKTVAVDEPKVVNGVVVDANDAGTMEAMAKELDAMDLDAARKKRAASVSRTGPSAQSAPTNIDPLDAVGMARTQGIPQGATALISLPKLSTKETQDLSERLVLSLNSEHGYEAAPTTVADSLSLAPRGVTGEQVLVKATDQATHVLRFGIRRFVSQPPQFWTIFT